MECQTCGRSYSTDEMAGPRECKTCAPIREIDGMPLRWGSPDGLIHAVEGDQMVPGDRSTFLLWTICGEHDVPANAGVKSHTKVTCVACQSM